MPTHNRDQLTIGPADIYVAPANEPAPATIDDAPAGNWTAGGFTNKPTTVSTSQEFAEAKPQQAAMKVRKDRTAAEVTISAELAQTTLANIRMALGEAGVITSTAAGLGTPGTQKLAIDFDLDTVEFAVLIDGVAPGGHRRRIYVPVTVADGSVELAHDRDEYSAVALELDVIDPGAGKAALSIEDKTAEAL